mmetsp:Transcript_22059/g.61798  ORF Transcript_22059/g.61798 Transcript_22059/m.61798 type:complete len:225 (+) Transcript_22059:382-1056(+)
MEPGPALVIRMSALVMYSSTFGTKPRIWTWRLLFSTRMSFHSSNACCTSSLRPHMTTIWLRRQWPKLSPTAIATSLTLPKPSPPHIISTTLASFSKSKPNFSRRTRLQRRSSCQKPSRTGNPQSRMRSSGTPRRIANFKISSLGTNSLSTRGSNHERCADPRSVTTVTTRLAFSPTGVLYNSCKASVSMWLISGWTEIIKSMPWLRHSNKNARTRSRQLYHETL